MVEKTKTGQSNDHNSGEAGPALRRLSEGGPVRHSPGEGGFDPAGLFAQLSRLLALYLARAEDADALANMAPKDALTCAKTVMALMSDLQGGKPASVDEDTQWPAMEYRHITGGAGVPPAIPYNPPARRRCRQNVSPGYSPVSSLEDAIAAVCNADEETQALEPWARLVARIDELCIHIQRDLDAWWQSDELGGQADETGGESVDEDWGPGDNGEPPEEPVLSPPKGDDPSVPTSFQLIESASADEVSENDNGNNTDFPARHNPRGP